MKKMITSDQAVLSKVQHKTPCSDCPFRRDSLKSWLGGGTPESFIAIALSEEKYFCHTKKGPQCAGMGVFRGNICKAPRNPNVLSLPKDTLTVFSWPHEFLEHHSLKFRTREEKP